MKSQLYIEVRQPVTKEDVSLDLARHLPRRLMAGGALIIVDRPQVWLAVLGKRWVRIVREVEREHASTLDRWKRGLLADEIKRMRAIHFGAQPAKGKKLVHARVATPDDILEATVSYCSLYITVPVTAGQLAILLRSLCPGGLLTIYGEWDPAYDAVIRHFGKNQP